MTRILSPDEFVDACRDVSFSALVKQSRRAPLALWMTCDGAFGTSTLVDVDANLSEPELCRRVREKLLSDAEDEGWCAVSIARLQSVVSLNDGCARGDLFLEISDVRTEPSNVRISFSRSGDAGVVWSAAQHEVGTLPKLTVMDR
jgi:hypothetical protein